MNSRSGQTTAPAIITLVGFDALNRGDRASREGGWMGGSASVKTILMARCLRSLSECGSRRTASASENSTLGSRGHDPFAESLQILHSSHMIHTSWRASLPTGPQVLG